jgi:hypothetical protein
MSKDMGLQEFLPKGYSMLSFYNSKTKSKVKISASVIVRIHSVGPYSLVSYYEGRKLQILSTPYTFEQITYFFSEGNMK